MCVCVSERTPGTKFCKELYTREKVVKSIGNVVEHLFIVYLVFLSFGLSPSSKRVVFLTSFDCEKTMMPGYANTLIKLLFFLMKVSNGAKIRNRYNQVPHLTQDTNGKVTNSHKTPQTRAKRSALSQQVTTKHI